jgi:hypothetical protein
MNIQELYEHNCRTKSDINEHLPTLKRYADECEHVTELGVRGAVSLSAFLASNAKRVVAVDILNVAVPESDKLTFICADDLTIRIQETDLLFIDTLHNYLHLKAELALHAYKAKKYIAFHDTFIFGENGDDGCLGLNHAIREFLTNNSDEWELEYHTDNNNGLTIIKRK